MSETIASYYNAQAVLSWAVSNAYTWNSTEYGETRCSQTFQVSEGSWDVEKVYFKGNRTKLIGPTAGDITVEIRETNETGALLGSGTLDRTTVAYSPKAWYGISISGVSLSSGNTYCLVFKCPYGYHDSDTHTYDSIYFVNNNVGYADGIGQKYTALNGWEALDTPGDFFFIVTGELTLPEKPTNPDPADDADDVDFSGFGLSWDDGGGADTYDVYLGPTGSLSKVSSAQGGTTYTSNATEMTTLFSGWPTITEIHWRIDATNDRGTTTGDEWHFASAPKVNQAILGAGGSFILCTTTRGLYLSSDLGSNWAQSLPDSDAAVEWSKGCCSGDGTYMVVVRESDNAIYRSANGGSSWGAITPAGGDTYIPYDLACSQDGQYMVIVGWNQTTAIDSCYISKNYGVTWTAHNPHTSAVTFVTCDISDNGQVVGVGTADYLYVTFDGGTRWKRQYPPGSNELWTHFAISGDSKVGIVANGADTNEWFKNSGWHNQVTVANTDFTSFARSVLDDSNAAEARTTLSAQQQGDVLDDLNTLGAAASDGEFLVATGAGVFAYESGNTARTSLGLGTGDNPAFTGLTLSGLTASQIVMTDGDKKLASSAILDLGDSNI